jgi:hypothetical protein
MLQIVAPRQGAFAHGRGWLIGNEADRGLGPIAGFGYAARAGRKIRMAESEKP